MMTSLKTLGSALWKAWREVPCRTPKIPWSADEGPAIPPDEVLLNTEERRSTFDYIDSLPWATVRHAYGAATDSPRQLRRLVSQDIDARMHAVCDFLYSHPWHQYSLYSATAYSMMSVARILKIADVRHLDSGMRDPMAYHMLHFLCLCAGPGQAGIVTSPAPDSPTIEEAALAAAEVCDELIHDEDSRISIEAARLLDIITRHRSCL